MGGDCPSVLPPPRWRRPTPGWGNRLSAVWGSVLNPTVTASPLRSQVWLTLLPSLMIFITVFTFNQLGEGLREAFDAILGKEET